ncbi:MAG: hypothetical protein NTV51_31095 [Verrucomicrobia bacterium]|nr:hypothetical protein [Verrucomicrobiota bacterium]
MAIIATTTNPSKLLLSLQQAIDDGSIDTWEKDADSDFTPSAAEWKNRAWFRPRVDQTALTFRLVGPEKSKLDAAFYGAFHGRLIETLLAHFPTQLSGVAATPTVSPDDNFNPA